MILPILLSALLSLAFAPLEESRAASLLPHGGRTDPPRSTFFDRVLGEWEGEGELFGRPTRFRMVWEHELGDQFVRLTYAIRGNVSMDAIAHYSLRDPASPEGVWLDSRGEMLELSAKTTDTTLETIWRSTTEQGRTTYEVIGSDSVAVHDYYHDGADWQQFGQAGYRRLGAASGKD